MSHSDKVRECETALADFQRAIERLTELPESTAPMIEVFRKRAAQLERELGRLKTTPS